MTIKPFLALLVAVAVAAIAGVITWRSLDGAAPAQAHDASAAPIPGDDGLRAENARLRERLRELEAVQPGANVRNSAPQIEEPPPPPPPETAPAAAAVAFAFDDPRYAEPAAVMPAAVAPAP